MKHLDPGTFSDPSIEAADRRSQNGHHSFVIWLTGLSGAGKTTLARKLERRLFEDGAHVFRLDGDNLRTGLNSDLGFSATDRRENVRRTAEAAKLLVDAGIIVIASLISPVDVDREAARHRFAADEFFEVYVDCPLAVCEERDPKGLYQKARAGQIPDFTGIDQAYEAPTQPDVVVRTDVESVDACLEHILEAVPYQLARTTGAGLTAQGWCKERSGLMTAQQVAAEPTAADRLIVTLGDALIDFLPTTSGPAVGVSAYTPAPGGSPANVAACVAHLGGAAAFVGCRGEDSFGERLRVALADYGVDVRWFLPRPGSQTGLAFVELDATGERRFLFYGTPAAHTLLRPEDVPGDVIAAAAVLHVASISLSAEPARSATLRAVEMARAGGAVVSFDVNWRPQFWPDTDAGRQQVLALLQQCDLVKVNRDELAWLTGTVLIHTPGRVGCTASVRGWLRSRWTARGACGRFALPTGASKPGTCRGLPCRRWTRPARATPSWARSCSASRATGSPHMRPALGRRQPTACPPGRASRLPQAPLRSPARAASPPCRPLQKSDTCWRMADAQHPLQPLSLLVRDVADCLPDFREP